MSIAYRPAEAADLPFLVGGLLDSLRTSPYAGLIQMEDWQAIMPGQVRAILVRPGVAAHVAYFVGETDRRADLAGFIIVERGYLDRRTVKVNGRHVKRVERTDAPLVVYLYVKKPYRGEGLAKGLMKAAGVGPVFNYAVGIDDHRLAKFVRGRFPMARLKHLVVRFPKETDVSQARVRPDHGN